MKVPPSVAALLEERGATGIHAVSGGKHPFVVFTLDNRKRRLPFPISFSAGNARRAELNLLTFIRRQIGAQNSRKTVGKRRHSKVAIREAEVLLPAQSGAGLQDWRAALTKLVPASPARGADPREQIRVIIL